MSPKQKVNKDQKTKADISKTTQTVPTPSESTPIFVKRIVTDYFYSPAKSNMSSKERIEDLDRFLERIMLLGEQHRNISLDS